MTLVCDISHAYALSKHAPALGSATDGLGDVLRMRSCMSLIRKPFTANVIEAQGSIEHDADIAYTSILCRDNYMYSYNILNKYLVESLSLF